MLDINQIEWFERHCKNEKGSFYKDIHDYFMMELDAAVPTMLPELIRLAKIGYKVEKDQNNVR